MATIGSSLSPSRGQVWFINLGDPSDPHVGHEQANNRPALVVSVDKFNQGPADLVIVIPASKVAKGIPTHVEILPPEGGVNVRCFLKCEAVRSISKKRLIRFMGTASDATMEKVDDRIRILLGL
jgi:mRNA interferase MazF